MYTISEVQGILAPTVIADVSDMATAAKFIEQLANDRHACWVFDPNRNGYDAAEATIFTGVAIHLYTIERT